MTTTWLPRLLSSFISGLCKTWIVEVDGYNFVCSSQVLTIPVKNKLYTARNTPAGTTSGLMED